MTSIRCAFASAGSLAILFATSSASAQSSTWLLSSARFDYLQSSGPGSSEYVPYDSSTPVTVSSTSSSTGISVVGSGANNQVVSLLASQAGTTNPTSGYSANRLTLSGTADLNFSTWDSTMLELPTNFNFGWEQTGGVVEFFNATTSFTLFNAQGDFLAGVGSGFGDPLPVLGPYTNPGGYGTGFDFVDNFGGVNNNVATINWRIELYFNWYDLAANPDSRFTLLIGPPGVNADIRVVPTPSVTAALGLAGLLVNRRRR
jgi:hypothetical protein